MSTSPLPREVKAVTQPNTEVCLAGDRGPQVGWCGFMWWLWSWFGRLCLAEVLQVYDEWISCIWWVTPWRDLVWTLEQGFFIVAILDRHLTSLISDFIVLDIFSSYQLTFSNFEYVLLLWLRNLWCNYARLYSLEPLEGSINILGIAFWIRVFWLELFLLVVIPSTLRWWT